MALRSSVLILILTIGGLVPCRIARATVEPSPGHVPDQGWTSTRGGRGGRIIRVTNLKAAGPGAFAAAVAAEGPRIVVFEVAGAVDLNRTIIPIVKPYLTVAGQTAPSPGITFTKGGISIQTHDVIVQHIRVRPGEAGAAKKSGWEVDAIATSRGAHDVIVDHCSVSWATDENLSASGPRFDGPNLDQWQANTSHRITFSNCVIAEGLNNSTHSKGGHSKGSLIHDNATDIAIIGNLYASNVRRNPFFKGGAMGLIANNYIYNPGSAAIHYNLSAGEWTGHPYAAGRMAIIGNVMKRGPNTKEGMPLFHFAGSGLLDIFMEDNLIFDRRGKLENPPLILASTGLPKQCTALKVRPSQPEGIKLRPADEVQAYVLENAGARPWDRDETDRRIVRQVREGTNRVIDSEKDVGGYPRTRQKSRAFEPSQWDLDSMTRYESTSR
jgi:pectate lyase